MSSSRRRASQRASNPIKCIMASDMWSHVPPALWSVVGSAADGARRWSSGGVSALDAMKTRDCRSAERVGHLNMLIAGSLLCPVGRSRRHPSQLDCVVVHAPPRRVGRWHALLRTVVVECVQPRNARRPGGRPCAGVSGGQFGARHAPTRGAARSSRARGLTHITRTRCVTTDGPTAGAVSRDTATLRTCVTPARPRGAQDGRSG